MITTVWNGNAVRPFEAPAVLIVLINPKTTLMHKSMMPGAQQHQILEAGFTTGGPVFDVVGVDEALV